MPDGVTQSKSCVDAVLTILSWAEKIVFVWHLLDYI